MYEEKKTSKEKKACIALALLVSILMFTCQAGAQNYFDRRVHNGVYLQGYFINSPVWIQQHHWYGPYYEYYDWPAHRSINRVYRRHFPWYYHTR